MVAHSTDIVTLSWQRAAWHQNRAVHIGNPP
jgi:hypothetical protein